MTAPDGDLPPHPGLVGGPVHLDYNATTPVDPRVTAAMWPYMTDFFGNPSSGHPYADTPRRALAEARAQVADLEGGEQALAFSSGMAAEAATFLARCRTGDHIVCIGEVHGGTFELLGGNLSQVGITTTFLRADEVGRLPEVLTGRTRIMFFETPADPTLTVFDIAAIAAQARAAGALTVVDNTFATPVNQNPLAHGADLVVHSATKYLGGHSDLAHALDAR